LVELFHPKRKFPPEPGDYLFADAARVQSTDLRPDR